MSLLAQRYAKAIFEAAQGGDVLQAVDADLSRLAEALGDPSVRAAVMSPDTTGVVREKIVATLLGDAHELTKNLAGVVLGRRRESALIDIAQEFQSLLRESRGEILGTVESAKPLDEEGLASLEAHATKLAGKKVKFDVEIDPDLIGGVRLRLGNTLYDGSVATVLEDLERRLMEAPL